MIIVQRLNSHDSWVDIKDSLHSMMSWLSIHPFQDNKAIIHCYNISTATRLCRYTDWSLVGNHRLKFSLMNTQNYFRDSMVSTYGGWIAIHHLPSSMDWENFPLYWRIMWQIWGNNQPHSTRDKLSEAQIKIRRNSNGFIPESIIIPGELTGAEPLKVLIFSRSSPTRLARKPIDVLLLFRRR